MLTFGNPEDICVSHSFVMALRSLFFMYFNLENERSALQSVTMRIR